MAGYYALLGQRGPSLMEIMHAAGLTRQQREAREMQRQGQEFDRKMRVAEFNQASQHQQATEDLALRKSQADQAAAEQKRIANVRRTAAQFIRANPASYNQVVGMLRRNGALGDDLTAPDVVDDPGVVQQFVTQLEGSASGSLGAPDAAANPWDKPTSDEVEFARVSRIDPRDQRWGPEFERWQLAKRRAGASSVNVGTGGQGAVGLTTGQQGSVQGDVMSADKGLARVKRIRERLKAAGGAAEMASFWERGKAAAGSIAQATPAGSMVDQEGLRLRREAEAEIATFRNQIFNRISGAAISESEKERLMQSVPDTGDPDIEAKLAVWEGIFEEERKYGIDALTKGIRTEGGARGSVNREHPVNQRISELMRAGASADQARAQAVQEYRVQQGGR